MFYVLLLIFLGIVLIHKIIARYHIGPNEPPLVSGFIPYLGVALNYGWNPKDFLYNTCKKQGDIFSVYIAGKVITVVLDPSFNRAFYRFPEETFDFYNGLRAVRLDEALGPTFHPQRAMLMMQILQNKFIPKFSSYIPSFINECDYILQNTDFLSYAHGTVDIWKLMDRMVIGLSLKSIVATHARHEELCGLIMELEQLAQKLLQRPGFTGDNIVRRCNAVRSRIYEILEPETEKRRETIKTSPEKLPQDILTIAIQNCEDAEVIRDAPVGVLFGAVANTNAVATLALWHVCNNPELLSKVRKEVDEVMMECHGVLNEEVMAKLELVEACGLEITRMYAIPISVRLAANDICIKGYRIPKGRYVAISSLLAMRNSEIFPHPDKYDPFRFIKGSPSYSSEQSRNFSGFGGGRHVCKGMKLAKIELRILLATLLHRYDFSFPEGSPELPDLEWVSLGVAFPKSPVYMNYRRRKEVDNLYSKQFPSNIAAPPVSK